MTYREIVIADKSGTVKNMVVLIVLYAIAGCIAGASFVFSTSCAGVKPIFKDVAPKVIELTAEECVKIATRDNRPDLADLCATVEDLAPFLDLIMAQQKARLARQGDGGAPAAPDASLPAPSLSCTPAAPPPPCSSIAPPAPAPAVSSAAPAASSPAPRGHR